MLHVTCHTLTLPATQQEKLRLLMQAKGVVRAAQIVGVCRHTLERAAGGLTVQRGSMALLEKKLAERDAAGIQP
jgi:hypothetical protein